MKLKFLPTAKSWLYILLLARSLATCLPAHRRLPACAPAKLIASRRLFTTLRNVHHYILLCSDLLWNEHLHLFWSWLSRRRQKILVSTRSSRSSRSPRLHSMTKLWQAGKPRRIASFYLSTNQHRARKKHNNQMDHVARWRWARSPFFAT